MIADRRIGRFSVRPLFLELDNLTVRELMKEIVVLSASYDLARDSIEYVALCEQFAPVPQYLAAPRYNLLFSRGGIAPLFEEVKP
jgi:hypothetical protein